MSAPPKNEKAPVLAGTRGDFKNQTEDVAESDRNHRSRQSSRVVNRWSRLHEANACYDRWLESCKTDLAAAQRGADAYDDFFRTSQHPADVAFVKFYDACLAPEGSAGLDRKRMMSDVVTSFSATFSSMASVCRTIPQKERRK